MFQAPQINFAQAPKMDPVSGFLEQMRAAQQARLAQEQQDEAARRNQALEQQAAKQQALQVQQERRVAEQQAASLKIQQAQEERARVNFEAGAVEKAKQVAAFDPQGAQQMLQMVMPGALVQRQTPAMPQALADRPIGLGDATPQAPEVDEESAASKARRYYFDPALGPVPDDRRMPTTGQPTAPLAPEDQAQEDQRQAQIKARGEFDKQKAVHDKAQAADRLNPTFTMQLPGQEPSEFRPLAERAGKQDVDLMEARQLAVRTRELAATQVEPWKAREISLIANMLDQGLLLEPKEAVKEINFILQSRNKAEAAALSAQARASTGSLLDYFKRANLDERRISGDNDKHTKLVQQVKDFKREKKIPDNIDTHFHHMNAIENVESGNTVLQNQVLYDLAKDMDEGGRLSDQDYVRTVGSIGGLPERLKNWATLRLQGKFDEATAEIVIRALKQQMRQKTAEIESKRQAFKTEFADKHWDDQRDSLTALENATFGQLGYAAEPVPQNVSPREAKPRKMDKNKGKGGSAGAGASTTTTTSTSATLRSQWKSK
jgi:hypothetical protein